MSSPFDTYAAGEEQGGILHRTIPTSFAVLVAMLVAFAGACGGGATRSQEGLCEAAQARSDVFTAEGFRTASPRVIGALRELANEAPARLRDDFERAAEASSDAELDQALTRIEKVLNEECGIDVVT